MKTIIPCLFLLFPLSVYGKTYEKVNDTSIKVTEEKTHKKIYDINSVESEISRCQIKIDIYQRRISELEEIKSEAAKVGVEPATGDIFNEEEEEETKQ
jgi:hypothetical protein